MRSRFFDPRGSCALWLVLAACGHRAPTTPVGTLSPPVTLEEFRAAFPTGTTILMRYTSVTFPTVEERWTWTATDLEGGTIAGLTCDADGQLLSDQGEARATWTELMSHGTFPADATVRSEAAVDVMAGHFETWVFEVQETSDDGTPQVSRYHFDRSLPGPPVLLTTTRGGEEVMRMELVERDVGPPAPGSRCAR